MALPSYPSGIRYEPLADSWSLTPTLPPIVTEMDGGNARQRFRPGDNTAIVQQTIKFPKADYATFDAFRKNDIGKGAARFTMPVWLGSSFETKVVQMMIGDTPPQTTTKAGFVFVPMKLRVFNV